MKISSKAKTLEDLSKVIKNAKVLPLVRFYAKEYEKNKNKIFDKVLKLKAKSFIVRSSSINEDNENSSNAGMFDSILNVKFEELDSAIKRVINSYKNLSSKDEVFIQPMLLDVTLSGVIFTADINTLAPYYVINYDFNSTNSVTSGKDAKTLIVYKNYKNIKDEKIAKLIKAAKECEEIFNNEFLDIEFAFSKDELYILQVRKIVTKNKQNLSNLNLDEALSKIYTKIQNFNKSHPKLLGKKTIFGVMPDWNPAEIIGLKPKMLALSLYKELITDNIWAYQRDNYGYRNLRSFPLLISFLGIPYIDVRVSFNSFIPKSLHVNIAEKLVNYYLDELQSNTKYHDKIEFEIVFSCYYFGISKRLSELKKYNFNNNEIKRIEFSLLELTNNILNNLYKKDLQKIAILEEKYDEILNSNLSIIEKIYWLIEDCKRYGTLPFAGLARAAFIAMQFLNSLVSENIISLNEKNLFLNSLNTISKQLSLDKAKLSKEEFIKKYGHLRPGTYDITSKRYDEDIENYFDYSIPQIKHKHFEFSKEQIQKIDKLIIEHGLNTNAKNLIQFIKEAIEAREYAKFVFTRHLSKILELIKEFGEKYSFTREDLAYLDIQIITKLYSYVDYQDIKEILKENINKNKELYKYTLAIKLPTLITDKNDIYYFHLQEEEPNFITLKNVYAKIVEIDKSKNLENKIVLIPSADPGYDYVFSKNIAGLVTCYGGVNSHMAIRCAELGIPAVIGCGEKLYNKIKNSKKVFIDCENRQIKL